MSKPLFLLQATYPMGFSALQIGRLNYLNDITSFYNSNNRAVTSGGTGSICKYHMPDGRTCAIGKGVPNEQVRKKINYHNISVDNEEIFFELPSDVQKLGVQFLSDIQTLHDNKEFWDENGLSLYGDEYVEKFKRTYNIAKTA